MVGEPLKALQNVTDTNTTTHRTFDLSPYGTPRAVVAQESHLSVDLVRASDQDPDWGLMAWGD